MNSEGETDFSYRNNLKRAIFLFILFLVLLSFIKPLRIFSYKSLDKELEFWVKIPQLNDKKYFKSWYCEKNGEYYLFLPSFMSQNKLESNSPEPIYILQDDQKAGLDAMLLKKGTYTLQIGNTQIVTLHIMHSSDISSLYIETNSGTLNITGDQAIDKLNEETGTLILFDKNGRTLCYQKIDWLKGRGNSTWSLTNKKSYNIKVKKGINLWGKTDYKFNLLANSFDKSLLRNKFVLDFASKLGIPYTPQSELVDLYINGSYMGLYQLSQKVKETVNIENLQAKTAAINLPLEQFQQSGETSAESGTARWVNIPNQ